MAVMSVKPHLANIGRIVLFMERQRRKNKCQYLFSESNKIRLSVTNRIILRVSFRSVKYGANLSVSFRFLENFRSI